MVADSLRQVYSLLRLSLGAAKSRRKLPGGHGDIGSTCCSGGHGHAIGRVCDGVPEVLKAVREELRGGADFIKIHCGGGVASPTVSNPLTGVPSP